MLKIIISYLFGRSLFESESNNKNAQLLKGKVIVGDRLYRIDDLKKQLAEFLQVPQQSLRFNEQTNIFYISGSNVTYSAEEIVNKFSSL